MDGLTNEFAQRSGLEFVDLLIEKKLMDGLTNFLKETVHNLWIYSLKKVNAV